MSVRPVLNAMKELISTSPATTGDDTGAISRLTQCLQANLKSYRDLLQKLDPKYHDLLRTQILHFKDAYHLTDPSMVDHTQDTKPQAHDTYLEFIPEGLSLLLVLDKILCSLHDEDVMERSANYNVGSSGSKAAPQAPKSLLSISDQKIVTNLAQFIVSLGIFPYLSPPLDALLKMRLSHAKLVEKYSSEKTISSEMKTRYLYRMCCVFMQCFGNPVFGPNLLSQHLSDVLVALLQICYAPHESSVVSTRKRSETNGHSQIEMQQCGSTPGDVRVQEGQAGSLVDKSTTSSELLNVCEREWCMEALHRLLNKTYQPLVVRELLAIQQISSIHGPTSRGKHLICVNVCYYMCTTV